jgi:cysteine-rich repeat protein
LLALAESKPASAIFHDISVKEVFAGSAAQPNAQYVLLQAYSGGQNSVSGHSVLTFNAAGGATGTFTFVGGVGNPADQMTILVATADAAAIFNLTADLTMTAVLDPAGGKVCWEGSTPVDCVAWGNYTGSGVGVGTPYNQAVGLTPGYAARRRLDICLSLTTLQSCDDTDNSANDFITVIPQPISNPGVVGTTPPATCGNGTLEGLEGCDDDNTADGDGCSAICRVEPAPLAPFTLFVETNQNLVLEPGEFAVVAPAWANGGGSDVDLTGQMANFTGPGPASYLITDGGADYGTIAPAGNSECGLQLDCYLINLPAQARPAAHWDATFDEILSNGGVKTWTLHVGDSFLDVPTSNIFYSYIETIFHNGVTGGCGPSDYCPGNSTLRQQMAVFVLKALEGATYLPPPCTGVFNDVACPSLFADWIEELYNRGVVAGCATPGGPNYCPTNPVLRQQMPVFLLKTLLGSAYTPPACTPGFFPDVPCPSLFADWIEDLFNLGITGGCGGGNYCPGNPTTRGQMAVFLDSTFGLLLYGP